MRIGHVADGPLLKCERRLLGGAAIRRSARECPALVDCGLGGSRDKCPLSCFAMLKAACPDCPTKAPKAATLKGFNSSNELKKVRRT